MKIKLPLFLLLAILSNHCYSQIFTNLHMGLPGLQSSATAWGDIDNDGDQDLLLEGFSSIQAERGFLYRNDNGTMVLIDSSIIHVSNGSANWGDYDNDGDQDLLINGQNNGSGMTELYRNDSAVFTPVHPGLYNLIGIMRWIDYDHDGFLDIVGAGIEDSAFEVVSPLYHNNGNGTFSLVPTNLPPMTGSDIQVEDYDHDGLPDLFITGRDINFSAITGTFHNDGNGNFTMDTVGFRQMWTGTAKLGDMDNDGDIDILYDGVENSIDAYSLIYLNDGNNHFTESITNLPPTGEPGCVDWADIDHDNDLDVLLSGSFLMRNDGGGNFTDISPWSAGLFMTPVMFVDYDNDGDADIFNVNFFNSDESTIYRNELISGIDPIDDEKKYSIYPNPVHSYATIDIQSIHDKMNVRLFNSTGSYLKNYDCSFAEFNFSDLPAGFYFLEFSESKQIHRLRFVKE
jgi:hypothetical protein